MTRSASRSPRASPSTTADSDSTSNSHRAPAAYTHIALDDDVKDIPKWSPLLPHHAHARRDESPKPHVQNTRSYITDPLSTPPYIYTPSTPPATTSFARPRGPEWLAHLSQGTFHLCDDDIELRLRELQEAARSLAALRASEQAWLLKSQKMHRRRQKYLRRALELAEASGSESESDDGCRLRELDEEKRRWTARKAVKQARVTYERNWEVIAKSSCPLSFSRIPWPVLTRPVGPSSMNKEDIAEFVLGSLTRLPEDALKRKERVKAALMRWHPDKFARIAARVEEREKELVLEASGNVARCLNELL